MTDSSTTCSSCGGVHPGGTETCPVAGTPVVNGGPCGTRVDRYEVQRWLGGGGMGAVYRARHAMMGQTVALKLLHPKFAHDPGINERFLREARAAASIASPHIVKMFDFGTTPEGMPFLAMELLEGESLEAMLDTRGAIAPERAVEIAIEMLDGLGAAHAAGIVHRDMKPANVFLARSGENGKPQGSVKLVDFGISKVLDSERAESLTRTGMVLGTPYYMAPEQFENAREVDHRADLYATAVILYQMLSGALPFRAANYQELLARVLTESPQSLAATSPSLPRALSQAVDRGLARSREARWQSAQDFSTALRSSLGALASSGGAGVPNTDPRAYFGAANTGANSVPPQSMTGIGSAATWFPTSGADITDHGPPPTQQGQYPLQQTQAPQFAMQQTHASQSGVQPQPWTPTPQNASGSVGAPPRSGRGRWVIGAIASVLILGSAAGGLWWYSVGSETPPGPELLTGDKSAVAAPTSPAANPTPVPVPLIPGVNAPAEMAPIVTEQPDEDPAEPESPAANTAGDASGGPITIGTIRANGHASAAVARAAMESARPLLDECRRVGRDETVNISAMLYANGTIALARPADLQPGDPNVARCVAAAFQSTAPLHGTGFGTVTIGVTIPAR